MQEGPESEKEQIEAAAKQAGIIVTVCWPYELMSKEENDRLGDQAKFEISTRCKAHLNDADIVIALLHGSQVDDGTAWEIASALFLASNFDLCLEESKPTI